MIHHSAPEKVVEGVSLAASRSGITENNQHCRCSSRSPSTQAESLRRLQRLSTLGKS
jgi:hypothetical protein